jgi:hypothetical protein
MDPNSPVFISPGSIDPESAASPIQVTLAIFWNLGHTWYQHKGVQPFLSTGGKVEFEGVRPKEVQPSNNTMSQWQLWIKGGFGW